MKTNKAMKTNSTSRRGHKSPRENNVQRAVLRSVAVIISFVLVSYTVSAQEFWKKLITNSSFNEIAIAMIETNGKISATNHAPGAKLNFFYLEEANDPALEVENWMTNSKLFETFSLPLQNETEVPLALENWMLDDTGFEAGDNN
ncbi:hypothetical protein SAMN05444280_1288 [Tangfeifania diversioriginum]|uniref:Uncharacterized protein n=1 Tax=Tangfeifania diversioriginum TaxID=1168035 RepID=A0A1M6LRW2_9BACT|nr:hypothetical protein [Tangfeifania diversioriginum]SHJ73940.1 hypothetical protein SAMN05444280_1288 [Tangfeifania diversioriginum]